jgi:RNA polymerase sigma-70 factor, ECF subfamily
MRPQPIEGLFRIYSRRLRQRAGSILGDGDAADDVVQEVFLRALATAPELSGEGSPVAWLYRVTTNLCLNRLRDDARHRRLLSTGLAAAAHPDAEPAVETALTARALMRRVPSDLQAIAVYYFVDDMSQEEITSIVGLPRRTVGYRLEQFRSRALAAA